MIGRLHHVGVATPTLAENQALYRDLFGATRITQARALPEHGVSVSFVSLPNAEIELLAPLGDTGPIADFLRRHPGGGQHHVCFEVDDLLLARDTLLARGARVIGSGEPRVGAHGAPVLFIHPRSTGGVLVELMQAPATSAERHALVTRPG